MCFIAKEGQYAKTKIVIHVLIKKSKQKTVHFLLIRAKNFLPFIKKRDIITENGVVYPISAQ